MENISTRIGEIITEMEGPDRGKQTRLAKIAGCTKGLINQVLNNPNQDLGYEYAKNIENILGYRADWILRGKLPKKAADAASQAVVASNDIVTADEIIDLITVYKNASISDRTMIMSSFRAAAERATKRRGSATGNQH